MIPIATAGSAPLIRGVDLTDTKSKKRKIEKIEASSDAPISQLVPFTPQEVRIQEVATGAVETATIFLTCERSYPRLDGGVDWTRLFTLSVGKTTHPVGDLSVDYRSTHLWVERLKNRQQEKYKGVGSALMQTVIRESFLQGKKGCVHLYSHGRTAGFYWKLGFTPLQERIAIPRYPGLEELTEKLVVCKKRLSRITSSDRELWPIVAEAQKILAEDLARRNMASVVVDGEYLIKKWFWSHTEQPKVFVNTLALFRAFFENKPLQVDQKPYAPLPAEDLLEGEMVLSQKAVKIWKERFFPS